MGWDGRVRSIGSPGLRAREGVCSNRQCSNAAESDWAAAGQGRQVLFFTQLAGRGEDGDGDGAQCILSS
jgi:hypothetical protein